MSERVANRARAGGGVRTGDVMLRGLIALASLVLGAAGAQARAIHYGAVVDAALAACDRQQWRGEIEAARGCYAGLLAGDSTPAIRAEAAWALNDPKGANRWFRAAMDSTPEDLDTHARWGELYADTHQHAEALKIFREVLAADPQHAFAAAGAARVLAQSYDGQAGEFAEPLMANDDARPGARLRAMLLNARMALERGDMEGASAVLGRASALVERESFPPLELYALRAAEDLLRDVVPSPWIGAALSVNPRFGGVYETPAHLYVVTRRYRQAIELLREAVAIEPGLASAHEALGVNLLRDSRVGLAREHLEIAHDLDPFSPVTVNTLRLLDSYSRFTLVNDPPVSAATGGSSAPGIAAGDPGLVPLSLRLRKDEAPVLSPYIIELTRAAIRQFTQRYGFTLREPVTIEFYPDHEDFAVRTAGMPGLGILGATFGYLLAMDSPSGRPAGQFQWGTTLWHELAHVFTLEASKHLVPRWFSEGISVFEEWTSGPNPGVRIPPRVYAAMAEDRFLPVAQLDAGFVRPGYPDQVLVSYMQAGLVCLYVAEHFGTARLAAMLEAFGNGADTVSTFRTVLGRSTADFDADFNDYVRREHSQVYAQLARWRELQEDLAGALAAEDWSAVIAAAGQSLQIFPAYVDPDSAWLALARAHEAAGEAGLALQAWENWHTRGGYDADALRQYAGALRAAGRPGEAIEVLADINLVAPFDDALHLTLGAWLLEAGDARRARREFQVALALDPHDRADVYFQMARAEHALGNADSALNHLLNALDIAPGYRPALKLLLEIERAGT